MKVHRLALLLCGLSLFPVSALWAAEVPPAAPAQASQGATLSLLDLAKGAEANNLAPTSEQVTVVPSQDAAAPGFNVTIQPGKEGYPGINITPAAPWNLSAFGRVEARLTNTGSKGITVCLRIDNAGNWQDDPWNGENVFIKPGDSRVALVRFGYSFGHPGYALKSDAVIRAMLFTTKAPAEQSFRVEWLRAAGVAGEKPPVDPASIRIKPVDGILLGQGSKLEAAQVAAGSGKAELLSEGKGQAIRLTLPAGKNGGVTVRPTVGKWDLRDANEVHVTLKNEGTAPLSPRVQVGSESKMTDVAKADAIAPGQSREIVVSFTPETPWTGIPNSGDKTSWNSVKGTGTEFMSDRVDAIKITADAGGTLLVNSIVAKAGTWDLPEWVGKRPPVEGQWVKTFADEFDGAELNTKNWRNAGPNFWDRKTHWSKDNLIVGGGVARLRYEKKRGYQNDDPKQMLDMTNPKVSESDYASGLLESYGKWVQRYGYFETRMKLPRAPGLWPAFWLMPDRGVAAGPQWKRQDTKNGGMEFDVMEHLTRWGPYRYNIAQHWDGYQKEHKSTGSQCIYFAPDKDGFITAGILWLPGKIAYYANGREVARWEAERISSVPANLLFTLPMGGWDNNAVDDKQLPDDFVIDYVRCWQRSDLASDVDGFKAPAANP